MKCQIWQKPEETHLSDTLDKNRKTKQKRKIKQKPRDTEKSYLAVFAAAMSQSPGLPENLATAYNPGMCLLALPVIYETEGLNKTPLYLFSAVYKIIPRTPQEIISPSPTVSIINGIGRGTA